jgi:hypothetical protein
MAEKHDRLDSQFSIVSAFWEPQAPKTILPGTLTNDDDGLTFTTAPRYGYRVPVDPAVILMWLNGSEAVPRMKVLQGFSADGICTLCNLLEIAHPGLNDTASGHCIEANSYRASVLVGGIHLGGMDDRTLTSARFTFTGLSEWLPSTQNEVWEKEHVVLRTPLNEQEVFSLGVRETFVHVSLKIVSEIKSNEDDGGRVTRPVAFLEIESSEPESLNWYFGIGNRLENFFSLLLGASLAMETMFVYRGDEAGHVVSKRKRVVEKVGTFDCVRCTRSQLAHATAVWLSQPEEFRLVENLALGVLRKVDLFYETELLSLTQALEGLHRVTSEPIPVDKATLRRVRKSYAFLLRQEKVDEVLASRLCNAMSFANEPSFASRLEELCGRLSVSVLNEMGIEVAIFTRQVVATRNFYTHAGSKISSRRKVPPLTGPAVFYLNQKLRALLRAVLLLHLGLPEQQITTLATREATRWR